MRRILQAGGEIHIPPETYVLGKTVPLFRRNQHLGWDQLVILMLGQFEFHREFETFGISLRPLAAELSEMEPNHRSLAALLDGFYRFHGRSQRQEVSRWGDKTPINVYSLDRLLAVFPDAQFIHMVRDGADVAASYVQSGLMTSLEDAAQRWLSSVRAMEAFSDRHPDKCLDVRYEALVRAPAFEAKRVASFSGLRFDPSQVDSLTHVGALGDVSVRSHHAEVIRPVHTDAIGKGREALSPDERQKLDHLLGSQMARWQYPPVA
jgi:hypothetical protein